MALSGLLETPLDILGHELCVDESFLRTERESYQAGYTIKTHWGLFKFSPLWDMKSAQVAKTVALAKACQLADIKDQTSYRNGFGVVQDLGLLWKKHHFLIAADVVPLTKATT